MEMEMGRGGEGSKVLGWGRMCCSEGEVSWS